MTNADIPNYAVDDYDNVRAPDINDMFLAGLPLREAVALEAEIKSHPEVLVSHWWALISGRCLRRESIQ